MPLLFGANVAKSSPLGPVTVAQGRMPFCSDGRSVPAGVINGLKTVPRAHAMRSLSCVFVGLLCLSLPCLKGVGLGANPAVARRIDATIARLPGLDWFNLLTLSLDLKVAFD